LPEPFAPANRVIPTVPRPLSPRCRRAAAPAGHQDCGPELYAGILVPRQGCGRAPASLPETAPLGSDSMGILSWIVFGLIAGLIAKLIMPGDDPGGFFITILLGIAGAIVGGFIATSLGYGGVDGFNFGSLIVAVIGSIVLLFGYRMIRR